MARRHGLVALAVIIIGSPAISAPRHLATPAASSASPQGLCDQLVLSIEQSEKRLAGLNADSIGDDSVARQTMRNTESTMILQEISIDIAQLAANKCAAFPHVISEDTYGVEALACKSASVQYERAQMTHEGLDDAKAKMLAACNQMSWQQQ